TVAEAEAKARRPTAAGAVPIPSIDQMQVTERESAVFDELKKKFSEDEARRYSSRGVGRSRQGWLHAAAIRSLWQRFSAAHVESLSAPERARWLGLIRGHADSFVREAEGLRRDLSEVFPDLSVPPAAAGGAFSDTELQARVRELYEAAVTVDRGMSSSFGV